MISPNFSQVYGLKNFVFSFVRSSVRSVGRPVGQFYLQLSSVSPVQSGVGVRSLDFEFGVGLDFDWTFA